jgi:hypothetical protein
MPIGILGSLAICTLLYVLVSLVITGIVPFNELNVPDPIALGADAIGLGWLASIIKLGAILGLSSVILVSLLGQPRIFYSMARDGLLPPFAAIVHQRPIGYNCNWLRRGPNTLSLLQELGYIYHIDDLSRDEPFIEQVDGKDFVVVPYTWRDAPLVRGREAADSNSGAMARYGPHYAAQKSTRTGNSVLPTSRSKACAFQLGRMAVEQRRVTAPAIRLVACGKSSFWRLVQPSAARQAMITLLSKASTPVRSRQNTRT